MNNFIKSLWLFSMEDFNMIRVILKIMVGALMITIISCASKHKAEKMETAIDKKQDVGGQEELGLKNGEMVVQKKVMMGEELRRLQTEVYESEDKIYGNRKYGSQGMYGTLKECRKDLADKKNGGDGKLKWTEPMDRITDKETEFKIGLDEKDQLVGVSEEYLKDRIERFKKYKLVLQGREDEMGEKLDICQTDLKSQKADVEKKSTSN
jgi:hypothetical protein